MRTLQIGSTNSIAKNAHAGPRNNHGARDHRSRRTRGRIAAAAMVIAMLSRKPASKAFRHPVNVRHFPGVIRSESKIAILRIGAHVLCQLRVEEIEGLWICGTVHA